MPSLPGCERPDRQKQRSISISTKVHVPDQTDGYQLQGRQPVSSCTQNLEAFPPSQPYDTDFTAATRTWGRAANWRQTLFRQEPEHGRTEDGVRSDGGTAIGKRGERARQLGGRVAVVELDYPFGTYLPRRM
jgi:hypothetical protein